MSLEAEISEAMKEALRGGEKKRLSVLRMILSELKVAKASGSEYDEQAVVQSYAKKLRKSADEYEDLGRAEEAETVREEMKVVEEFMPEQMGRAEIEQLVENLVEQNDWGPRDIGKLMKTVMGEHGDEVDGSLVNEIAREKLAQND